MSKAYTIVILGSASVGKSSLVQQFVGGQFQTSYKPTVEECYRRFIQLPDGGCTRVEILDTSGGNEFPAMRNLRIQHGDAFVVVYAINDVTSFQNAISICNSIFEIKERSNVPIILVGNKLDLGDSREVSTEAAANIAMDEIACSHIEASAKCNLNVKCLFQLLLLANLKKDMDASSPNSIRRQNSCPEYISRRRSEVTVRRTFSSSSCTSFKKKHMNEHDTLEEEDSSKCVIM
ncbi:ras-related protein Rap-1b-like [Gigantopelta aegis]|uniref:ras-related protein Rap-1b-like n=1 Tax=Gigantopelta aegis TaxID=1735272 RepID=UPI001B88A0B5|nr:ras-related protein Rap-1b-like [Gigantopelta aegis]